MKTRTIIVLLLAIAFSMVTGCGKVVKWDVLSDDDPSITNAKIRSLQSTNMPKLTALAAYMDSAYIHPVQKNDMNLIAFEEYKGKPVLSYNVWDFSISEKISKTKQAAQAFDKTHSEIISRMNELGLLDDKCGYGYIKANSMFTVSAAAGWVNVERWINFVIPVDLAKKYGNQEITVQELLSKSIVIIDGARNMMTPDDMQVN